MSLHPAFNAYLADLNPKIAAAREQGAPSTPESARAALASLNEFAADAVDMQQVYDRTFSYESDGEIVEVGVRVYVPHHYQRSDSIVFVHGGGHMAGDLDVYDWSARRTAEAANMITVSIDYRRSPEHRYPAGLTDTYQAMLHMPELLGEFDVTGILHGVADSGGAALMSSIAMKTAAGEWHSPLSRQALIYPSLDYTLSCESIATFGSGYFLEADRIQWYFDHYFTDGDDWRAASPVFGPFNDTMPDTLVIAAQFDLLLSEAERYVANVQAAGSRAELLVARGMIHAYLFFETLVPEDVDASYQAIAEFLRTGNVTPDARYFM